MTIAPAPQFPERTPQSFERTMGPDAPGGRGPLRFEEGIVTDTDVPNDFGVGIRQGTPSPARPNHNQKVDTKYPEETMRERAHVGSASWVDAPSVLSEFADGSRSGYGDVHFEQVQNSGLRLQRNNAAKVSG